MKFTKLATRIVAACHAATLLSAVAAPATRSRPSRPSPSRWSCPSRPVAATTSWRAPSRRRWARSSARPSSSRTSPAPAATSAPTTWPTRAPDGHTVVIASSQVTMNPFLGMKVPFKIESDFEPVGLIASVPIMLVANVEQPFKTLKEFIQYSKANPGQAQLQQPRQRHAAAHGRRGVRQAQQDRAAACALPRHRPVDRRPDRRPGAGLVRDLRLGHPARAIGQAARPGHRRARSAPR